MADKNLAYVKVILEQETFGFLVHESSNKFRKWQDEKNLTQFIKIGKEHSKNKNVDFHFWNFFDG